jgi:23S rRNA maturation-related 3'-5' exoribonuclease YhaM
MGERYDTFIEFVKNQKNQEWVKSIQLSKADKMDEDAIITAAESHDVTVAEELLRYFVEQKNAAVQFFTTESLFKFTEMHFDFDFCFFIVFEFG